MELYYILLFYSGILSRDKNLKQLFNFTFISAIVASTMSINSIYETAYKGDFNQVKVKVDENFALLKTTDEVSQSN